MTDSSPEHTSTPSLGRTQFARLRLTPNLRLYESLRRFQDTTNTVQRVGHHGLFLYSLAAVPVLRRNQIHLVDDDTDYFDYAQVDRIDYSLRHMTTGERRLSFANDIAFKQAPMGGLAIRMSARLNERASEILEDTSFVGPTQDLLPVSIVLPKGVHAPGRAMLKAAEDLATALDMPGNSIGTESIELTIPPSV